MPRTEDDPNCRPLRARILRGGDRVTFEPATKNEPPLEYWRGWLDGRTGADRFIAVLSILAAITGLIAGAILSAIFRH